jgi:uncharacterized membrane protein
MIPNWHPVFVHFTVALLMVSVLLFMVTMLAGNASWRASCLSAAQWNFAWASPLS